MQQVGEGYKNTAEYTLVKAYVLAYREFRKINPGQSRLQEPSAEAFGEFRNLVLCQLIPTQEGYGGWRSFEGFKGLDILMGAAAFVERAVERAKTEQPELAALVEKHLQELKTQGKQP
jgi:hypothetical protein